MAGRRRSILAVTGARGELAESLRRLRDQRGMTLRQVAARSGYSPATLSMAESGRRFPSWEVLAAFVQSCDADPAEWRLLWQSAARSKAEDRAGQPAAGPERPEAGAPEPGSPQPAAPGGPGGPGTGAQGGRANGVRPWLGGPRRLLLFGEPKATAVIAACVVIAAAALWVIVSHLVAPSAHPQSPRRLGTGPATSRVAPAHYVVAPESCGLLLFRADGAADPVTCPDGRPSLAADRYYRPLHLRVLGLGPGATPMQVRAAVCADLVTGRSTFPIETRAVALALAEQDWHFGVGPVSDVGPGRCPGR